MKPPRFLFLLAAFSCLPLNASVAGVLELDGLDSWVNFTNPTGLIPTGGSSFTIEAWINPTSIPAGGTSGGQITFWGNQTGNQANGFRMASEDGLTHYFWGNDFAVDPAPAGNMLPDTSGPSADGWHHVAISYDGTTNSSTWYQNGTPIGTLVRPGEPNVANANFRIGARADGNEDFHGLIDELRIWNLAQNDATIAAIFDKEIGADSSGLVAYFKFDGAAPDFSDSTDNGHDGTAAGLAATIAALNAPVVPQVDSDMDDLPDEWEQTWFQNLDQGRDDNPDNDGLTNFEELQFSLMLDPDDPDTDNDSLSDGDEVKGLLNTFLAGVAGAGPPGDPTNPLLADSDGDTLTDNSEIVVSGTDPNDADTDHDTVPDAEDPDPLDPDIPAAPADFGALSLDGTSFASFANDSGLIPTGASSFTIEAWINPTSIPAGGTSGGQISFWGTEGPNGTANGFRLASVEGVNHYFWGNDHTITSTGGGDMTPDTSGPNGDGWHHLAVAYDGATNDSTLYQNGAPVGTLNRPNEPAVANANFLIGKRPTGEFFDGYIDELRIWNVTRSDAEIANGFETTPSGNEPGLVAYWDFTNGSYADASGNGHLATPVTNATIDRFRNAPVARSSELAITGIAFDAETRTASVTWTSRIGRTYAIDFSEDLREWGEIDDNLIATDASTTYSEVLAESVESRFYRVREVAP